MTRLPCKYPKFHVRNTLINGFNRCIPRKSLFPAISIFNSSHPTPFNVFSSKRYSTDAPLIPQGKCPGCGAEFQSLQPQQPGYLPLSLGKTKPLSVHEKAAKMLNLEPDEAPNPRELLNPTGKSNPPKVCQRCHRMQHHSVEYSRQFAKDPNKQFSSVILAKSGIVINVVDVFDLPGSLVPNIDRYVGKNKFIILAVNKCDLLPIDAHHDRIKHEIKSMAKRTPGYGEQLLDAVLISARNQANLDELIQKVRKYRRLGDDIILVGMANSGKSQLLNGLVELCAPPGNINVVKSVSNSLPGTTANFVEMPLSYFGNSFRPKKVTAPSEGIARHNEERELQAKFIDTPGLFNPHSLLHLLTLPEIRLVIPKKPLDRPITYVLEPGDTLFLGGLARLDYLPSEDAKVASVGGRLRFTVFVGQNVTVRKTKTVKADEFYIRHVGKLLTPPLSQEKWPPMKHFETLNVTSDKADRAIADIVFDGLGWISVTGIYENVQLAIHTAGRLQSLHIREPALLPFEFAKKIAVGSKPFIHLRNKKE